MNKVHLVQFGLVACEMQMPPAKWPEGHKWSSDLKDVTCDQCKQNATETPLTFEILDNGARMRCRICCGITDDKSAIETHTCPFCRIGHDNLWPPARARLIRYPGVYGIRVHGKVVRTLCRVEEMNGKKRWVVVHNDSDPDAVGETTACGLPVRATEVSVGTTFETILVIPGE
jgi:hypothetical protein